MVHATAVSAPQQAGATLVYRFHGFSVDAARWELRDATGALVRLAPAPFRVLSLLIENRHRVVSKDELLDALWHEAIVSESALARTIGLVRRALGGGSTATRWVTSVRGRGYRFVAPVEERVCGSQLAHGRWPPLDSSLHSSVPDSVEATIDHRMRLAQLRWRLTPRQLDVLRGLVNGLSNGDLAQTLQCTLRTVEAHMTALLDRCDATSRLSLVATFWIDL